MKKAATWVLWIAFAITLTACAIIGIKLLDGDYEFTVEAYIAAASFFTLIVCRLIIAFGNKCPHCDKIIMDNGEYCSHCGKNANCGGQRPQMRSSAAAMRYINGRNAE